MNMDFRLGMVFIRKKRRFLLATIMLFALYLLMADDGTAYEGPVFAIKEILRNSVSRNREIGNSEELYIKQDTTQFCTTPLQSKHNIRCVRLISGETSYMKTISSLDFRLLNTSCNLTSVLSDCRRFRILHGYDGKPSSKEEVEFPIAFGIKVHKAPLQVEQLLRTIYRPQNSYCIHVDLKAKRSVSAPLLKLAKCFDNVFVIQKYNVIYSSIRQPLSDIACMKALEHRNWNYYIILAGQEFVLKTNLEIVKILQTLNGTNDIEAYPFSKTLKKRYTMSHFLNEDKGTINLHSNITKTPFKHNITLLKGSSYGMFSRAFVDFVLHSLISQDLFEWAHDIYAPEEMIWSTLNSLPDAPGGYKAYIEHKTHNFISRAMIWSWDRKKCNGKFYRSICIFTHEDLPWLVSSPQVVANKFHSDYNQLALDCLEEWIRNKTALGTTVNMNWFFYRNAPHVLENN